MSHLTPPSHTAKFFVLRSSFYKFRTPTKVPKNLNADETFPKGKQYNFITSEFGHQKNGECSAAAQRDSAL